MNKQDVWLQCFAAALGGVLAAEHEGFAFRHKADAAKSAAVLADFSLAEYTRRFGPFPRIDEDTRA